MRKIVTPALYFAWAAIFAILGIALVPGGGALLPSVLDIQVLHQTTENSGARELVSSTLALFCLSSAVLFAWSLSVSAAQTDVESDDGDYVARTAFAVGVGTLALCLIAGALLLVKGAFAIAAIALAGLVSSYVATFLERIMLLMASQETANDIRAATRLMALGAAHSAMLSKITGRTTGDDRETTR